jgi:hypothetical protein
LDRRTDRGRPDIASYVSSFVPSPVLREIKSDVSGLTADGQKLTTACRSARMLNALSYCEIVVQRKN